MSKHDLAALRKRLQDQKSSKRDPHEFNPPKAKAGQTLNYRFFILPPLDAGDATIDGQASQSMNGLYYVPNGAHWFNKRPTSCPRIHSGSEEECEICTYGFELMSEVEGTGDVAKKAKSAIAKTYLPVQKGAVNIYFPNDGANPEELRGKVFWFNASQTVTDICEACALRDDAGDPEDPQAFGVFYDEEAAFPFQLTITEQSGYNNYKTSKFLPNKRPLIAIKKGETVLPDAAKIKEILAQRHDLFTKFDAVDKNKIANLLKGILDKGGSEGGDSGGFDTVENAPKTAPKTATKPITKAGPAASAVVAEDLSGEGGEAEAPAAAAPAPKAATKPKAAAPKAAPTPAPEPAATAVAEPGADGEEGLDDLLTQLNTED
jgi:hypothetical protein